MGRVVYRICQVCFWILVLAFAIGVFDVIALRIAGEGQILGCRLSGDFLPSFVCPDAAFPWLTKFILNLPLLLFLYGPFLSVVATPYSWYALVLYAGDVVLLLGLAYPVMALVKWWRRRRRASNNASSNCVVNSALK